VSGRERHHGCDSEPYGVLESVYNCTNISIPNLCPRVDMRMKSVEKGTVVQKLGGYMRNVWPRTGSTCLQNPVVSLSSTRMRPCYILVQLLFER